MKNSSGTDRKKFVREARNAWRASTAAFAGGVPASVPSGAAKPEAAPMDAKAEHGRLFTESTFPSAATCRKCHPDHYREWSVSAHAYAQLSPVFNAMAATTTKLTSGANGDFCIGCHTQVGMNMGEAIAVFRAEVGAGVAFNE